MLPSLHSNSASHASPKAPVNGRGDTDQVLANQPEPKSFIAAALAWRGSVTPIVLPRVIWASVFASLVSCIIFFAPNFHIPITPFEYSGAVLALILVMRVNAGHDRWWEARKLWGSIVNQSRNLGIVIAAYGEADKTVTDRLLRLVAAWPHVMRESLRSEKSLREVETILGPELAADIRNAQHMPVYVGHLIAQGLASLRRYHMDPMAFHRAETERSALIDAIGACERIRNTRMPLALAIKTRRFLFLFLALLPFALIERVEFFTPLIMALASYPLFSLDEIGAELQNPFSPRNLSHLPLDGICDNIAKNVLALIDQRHPG